VKIKSLVLVGAVAGTTIMFLALRRYHRQLFQAYRQIASTGRLVETAKGLIEYADTGQGPAVLISPGMGGFDMGLHFAWPDSGFRYISVSRPGYLRTPLFSGRSFESQADAFAALLDHLGIDKVAMVGISSGGPAAIQFALRHPDRCWALVLISAPNQPLPASSGITRIFTNPILTSDFLAWLLFKPVVSKYYLDSAARHRIHQDSEKSQIFASTVKSLFPLSFRRDGILNDLHAIQEMSLYPIDLISAPTLVIHGDQDEIVPYEHGKWSAGRIRRAFFLVVQGGGHLSFITHLDVTRRALLTFLKSHIPQGGENSSNPQESI